MQNIPLPNCIFMPEHSLKCRTSREAMALGDQSTVYRKTAFVRESTGQTQKIRPSHGRMEKGNANFQTNFDPNEYASRVDAYMRVYGKNVSISP